MWNLRNKANEQRKKKKRKTQKWTPNSEEQTDSYQWGGGWGMVEICDEE